jgi:hypothetical protein
MNTHDRRPGTQLGEALQGGKEPTVLNKEERRQLSAIEARIAADDPAFADGMARGRPHSPRCDRRWPFQLVVIFGIMVALLGLVAGLPAMLVAGAFIACGGAVADRFRAIRRQGRRLPT